MKDPIMDDNGSEPGMVAETLPKSVEYPMGVNFCNQLYTADKIATDNSGDEILGLNAMHIEPSKPGKTISVAFGTRALASNKSPSNARGTVTSEFDNKPNKKGFHLTANQEFTKQLTNTTTSIHTNSTQTSLTKRSSRFKDLKVGSKTQAMRTPDVRCLKTLESQTQDENITEERDTSEPPKRKKNSHARVPSEAPHAKHSSKGGGFNIARKESLAHKQLVLEEKSNSSIQEQVESETDVPKKKDCIKTEPTHKQVAAKPPPFKKVAPAAARNSEKKSKVSINKYPPASKKSKPEQKGSPIADKSNPSAMLLQTVGANQLNTFGLQEFAQESSDEIEELIEGDDKQSIVSYKDNDAVTPLYIFSYIKAI